MPPKRDEKILVVDDDPQVLEVVVKQTLAPQGYKVATSSDGNAALQVALQTAPDIILTSLDLPGLSGRDLITALRSRGNDSLIIATGPRGADSQAAQAIQLGAKDYLGKPLREAELVAAFDRALAEVRLRRERDQSSAKLAAVNHLLEKRVKELTTLAGIGKAVIATTDLTQLFARLLEAGLFVTEAEIGWLVLVDDSTGQNVLRAGKNLPKLSTLRLDQPWDDGIASLLMLSGEGLTLAGPAMARLRAGQVVKAAVAVPLKAREKVIGVIVAGNKTGRPFTERNQAMLSAVADFAVVGIVNAWTFKAMEAKLQNLQQAYDAQASAGLGQPGEAHKLAQQLRAPLLQVRGDLEPVVQSQAGTLNAQQTELLRSARDRLAAIQRQLDALIAASAAPAAATGPLRSTSSTR
ncbi:MAG: response regulator [Burkholderiaceae bacterium]